VHKISADKSLVDKKKSHVVFAQQVPPPPPPLGINFGCCATYRGARSHEDKDNIRKMAWNTLS
jgi:hypothetical protein